MMTVEHFSFYTKIGVLVIWYWMSIFLTELAPNIAQSLEVCCLLDHEQNSNKTPPELK